MTTAGAAGIAALQAQRDGRFEWRLPDAGANPCLALTG